MACRGRFVKMEPIMAMIMHDSFASRRKTHRPSYERIIIMRVIFFNLDWRMIFNLLIQKTLSFSNHTIALFDQQNLEYGS